MNRARTAPLLLVAIAGLALAWWSWHRDRPPAVATGIDLYGNVDIREVQLAFETTERVAQMLAEEGQAVVAGDVLARLKTDRLAAQLERARARAAAQVATLAALEAGTRPEEVRKARADVAAAEAMADAALQTLRRVQDLAGRKLVAPEQVDEARAAADSASAHRRAAQEALNLALAGPRRETIDAARANLDAAHAELALAEVDLNGAELRAPVDAVVRSRILEAGDIASPQKPAYVLALTDPLWVRAWLPGPMLGHVRPGMRAQVAGDSFPGRTYDAWVGYISPTAEFTPKTVQTEEVRSRLVYEVRLTVCNPQGELRLGMPVAVHIPLPQPEAAATPPNPCPS